MIITEKVIRELQRRVDISYEDAEKYLRRAGGNIELAEKIAQKRANSFGNRLFREFEKIINAMLIYRLNVYKKEDQFLNVPILAFVIMLLIIGVDKTLLLGVVFIILALLGDCNLQINKMDNQGDFRFYRTVNKDEVIKKADADNDKKEKSKKGHKAEASHQQTSPDELKTEDEEHESDDDEYYEVTIDK